MFIYQVAVALEDVAASTFREVTTWHLYKFREREPYGLKNEALRKRIARAARLSAFTEVGATSVPMNHIYQAMRLIRHVKRKLADVRAPALVLHAIDDDTASAKSADFVVRHIGSPVVRKIYLDDSYHMVTMDNERELVARETRDFLHAQVGGESGVLAQPLRSGGRIRRCRGGVLDGWSYAE